MLEAALEAQQCGPKRLQVTGAWQWLLTEFGETYGIRDTYARLAHLSLHTSAQLYADLKEQCYNSSRLCRGIIPL